MIKKLIFGKLKDLKDIYFCYNCGAIISNQPDYNENDDIIVCAKCGAENKNNPQFE